MEENADPSAPEPDGPRRTSPDPSRPPHPSPNRLRFAFLAFAALALAPSCAPTPRGQALARVQATGRLVYGSDQEGGGPYLYPDPKTPRAVTGFEVDLMRALAREVGAAPEFRQGQWDQLLQNLDAGLVDLVVNGYEWTETRARDFLATRPYYVYQLQLLAPKGGPVRSWKDLLRPGPGGRPWKVAVLSSSGADTFAQERGGPHVTVVRTAGATDAMLAVANGQYDATLQDLPAASFYRDQYPALAFAGAPLGRGYYVLYLRRGDEPLRDALDRALGRLIGSGELRALYERHALWNDAQGELAARTRETFHARTQAPPAGWRLVRRYLPELLDAARVTVVLSVASMPLAMALGLFVALGRLYGPGPLRFVLAGYVEVLRGTPLMLQLFVLFYLLNLGEWRSAVIGLAVNYSAYEAEIYRAGLQAVPPGQMEAALALGMSRAQALRRVVVPQALRVVIPPVTNDFIALFKDTAVCSVINLVELTKRYNILANSTGGVVGFAVAVSALYMAMSVPLSWFSRWSERRLGASGVKGGGLT